MRTAFVAVISSLLLACAAAPRPVAVSAPPASQLQAASPAAVAGDSLVATIALANSVADEVAHALRNLVSSPTLRYVANERSNTIVAVGTADDLRQLRELVANLDTPPRTVPAQPAGR